MRFLLAGRAAERLVLGQVSSGGSNGVESDLAKAPLFALKMECEWGLLDPPFWRPAEVLLANGMPVEIQPFVESRLAEAARGTDRMLEGAHDLWSCRVFVPFLVLVQATWRSKHKAVCLLRGLQKPLMYWKMAVSACLRVSHDLHQINLALMVLKKVSTAALS